MTRLFFFSKPTNRLHSIVIKNDRWCVYFQYNIIANVFDFIALLFIYNAIYKKMQYFEKNVMSDVICIFKTKCNKKKKKFY